MSSSSGSQPILQEHSNTTQQQRSLSNDAFSEAAAVTELDSTGLELIPETVPGLLEKQVRLSPDALALNSYHGQWTYSQLWNEIDQLSGFFQSQGVIAGVRVGILLPLSAHAVMSILAIMKLGAAVVPVDIHHPHARQLTMFRESRVASVLVESADDTHKQIRLEFAVFDLSASKIAQEPSGLPARDQEDSTRSRINVANVAKPEDDAFIAFTSGSTGTPKGIVQGHAAIVTMSRALAAALDVRSSSRVAQIAPYVFDVAMMEFAMSFGTGAALCIMRKKELILPEPGELAQHLNQSQVTHITLSPTMLKSISVGSIPSVRVLSVMGESLDRSAVELWASTPEKRFVQFWGCTEGTILQSVTPPIASHHEPQNIGFALEKACRLWVVDADDANTLRKDGESGELVIESRALASRYINQPEQTARAFLKQVSWTTAGPDARFYRTGDLARKNPDGSVTFLGRQDGQMSLHGERVELGEIDYHIERLGLPRDADCFADFDAVSQNIVGFVCGHNQGSEIASTMPLTLLPWRDAVITKALLISHKTNRLELRELLKQLSPDQWTEYRVVPEQQE